MNIRKAGRQLPPKIVVVGVEGVGKTSFAAQFPNPFFVLSRSETGLQTLIDSGQLGETMHCDPLQTWNEVVEALQWASTNLDQYDTLVFDTLNGIERLYFDFVLHTEFDGSAEKYSAYGRDKTYPHKLWQQLLQQLDWIQGNKKSIVCLCHHTTVTFKNPEGPDYDRYVPRLLPGVWNLTFAWSDITLFLAQKVYLRGEKLNDKGKAIDGIERVFHTMRSPLWDAKNRHNLPASIPMGATSQEAYANFVAALVAARPNGCSLSV